MASSKLSAKAAKLDFSKLPGVPGVPASVGVSGVTGVSGVGVPAAAATAPGTEGMQRPKTAPGAMMAFAHDARSELLRENESLRARAAAADRTQAQLNESLAELAQWDGAKAARLIDPAAIQPSAYANRHETNYEAADYLALRAEIESAGGNVQPIKVRRLKSEGLPAGSNGVVVERYEVVFGHRRHRACLELGLPVLAVVDNLDDQALFVEMDRENRVRKDLSAWEQGMMYQRALSQGLFPSNRKLAEAIGADLSAVGKALALAALPVEVVGAFGSPLVLQFRWARPLGQALTANRAAVLAAAKALAVHRGGRKPKAVLDALVAAATSASPVEAAKGVEPFHPSGAVSAVLAIERGGKTLGHVERLADGSIQVTLRSGIVNDDRLEALAANLAEFVN